MWVGRVGYLICQTQISSFFYFFFIIKLVNVLHKHCESISALNPQINADRPYQDTTYKRAVWASVSSCHHIYTVTALSHASSIASVAKTQHG